MLVEHVSYIEYVFFRESGEGNAFSHVCLSVHMGCHVTITHDALDLIVQGPSWTCSNLFNMKHIQLASGQLPLYWNAFLFTEEMP